MSKNIYNVSHETSFKLRAAIFDVLFGVKNFTSTSVEISSIHVVIRKVIRFTFLFLRSPPPYWLSYNWVIRSWGKFISKPIPAFSIDKLPLVLEVVRLKM